MTLEEHLACPKCGYDLHGIPEIRCPECGFRYDAAALRSMAASAEWTRLAVAQDLIVRAAIAGALAVPAVCERAGISGSAQFAVIAVAYVAVFLTWTVLTEAYRGLAPMPNLVMLYAAIAVGIGYLLQVFPAGVLAVGVVVLAFAWFIRLRNWPRLSPPENIRPAGLRRSVARYSIVATSLLVFASLLVLFALVR
ncbi:MAG: hypothetical protein ACYTFA_15295 [Planctomycetota bacterium]